MARRRLRKMIPDGLLIALPVCCLLTLSSGNACGQADWRQFYKLTVGNPAAEDHLGRSVALSGERGVVGAYLANTAGDDSGSAYVFDVTTGQQLHELAAFDAMAGDWFGYSVAICDARIIVGAPHDDCTAYKSGSAYLFDATTGDPLPKLIADDAEAGDLFGCSVGISGDLAIVGAWSNDDAGSGTGSAYIFNINTGQQTYKLVADDPEADEYFGWSVAINGTRAIVGAYGSDCAAYNSGSAYVFDVLTGTQEHKLIADDAATEDQFGYSVGISGDFAIVGATHDDDAGYESGSAYVFNLATGEQLHKLTANDAAAHDYFGWSVGIGNDVAIVGATYGDSAAFNSGSTYVFCASTGIQIEKLTAKDATENDQFGWSVGISGDFAIVGAPFDDDTVANSGSAYIFGHDSDEDYVVDSKDNCPDHYNPEQADCDTDGVGDVCTIAECDGSPWCEDCNDNAIPDKCDIADGISQDCQPNGVPDECDIADGTSIDDDGDGIPDECQCFEDLYEDGIVDVLDLMVVLAKWGPCPPEGECPGDVNFDGVVDVLDLLAVLGAWGPCE